ncbi:MAG: hypothetical protein LBV17_05540 [Treponema sp.]|nr:hypothetical protein [Treponema sp.]
MEKMIKDFVCCFCGETIDKNDIIILNIHLNFEDDASQQLYSHKKCLKSKIIKDIPTMFDFNKD